MAATTTATFDLTAVPEGLAGIEQLRTYLLTEDASVSTDADVLKSRESAITQLTAALVKQGDAAGLSALLQQLRPFFNAVPKAKAAKIVRSIIDSISQVPNSTDLQIQVCVEQIAWAVTEKRAFLRQRIELRLGSLYLERKLYQEALALIGTLLSEVKKLDDKLLLVDIYLLESKVQHVLRNLAKARSSLTAARQAANTIYVPLLLQAEIDLMSGILSAEEKDFKTAFSYFYEGFEQYSALNDDKAVHLLKYMLLCKIMVSEASDVPGIVSGKAGLKYMGPGVEAMKAVAKASQDRSLSAFQAVLAAHPEELTADELINGHLTNLYDTLLEQNLVRLIEPFSRVEIAHVAKLISLPTARVENKLSQMILDKKFCGTLDQGAGCLEVFPARKADTVYPVALDVVESLGNVVDTLFKRSLKIVAV
eukprot:CAMPEP_0119108022 /NCGR_PEP_ID=MMETSP1180-20130426/13053_1 /TAXON_ID=3052 ORGANISM="Chlamydomonas cf sp, Strain CCMP681" /NCGR_SAMPLE_ID=MMETSP1180 /ASSEMBLY_ACC=CAM_ASM_000741 /LENGTH=422 /DNA_ID=CAMNT_0007093585 /DNA_START=16 /DNA_END=1284 /DNA_ORIENTATION=+